MVVGKDVAITNIQKFIDLMLIRGFSDKKVNVASLYLWWELNWVLC